RAGNRLTAPLVWSFTTAAAPSSSGLVDLIVTGAPPAPVLTSTFNSIGVEVFYTGDDDRDATAALRFKRSADPDVPASWRQGLPLWRTPYLGGPGRAFYGSALFLDPATAYDVEVTLADPDGTTGPRVLRGSATTRADALPPAGGLAPTRYVRVGGSDQANGL